MSIAENIQAVRTRIEQAQARSPFAEKKTRLMAVTKTMDPQRINEAIAAGVDLIGENRVQELLTKYDQLHLDGVEVHLIGHLQRNKVKYIIDKVDMIQSVDSLPLAEEIERRAAFCQKVMPVLVEVHMGHEESKFGVEPRDLSAFLQKLAIFPHISVRGLMTVPPPCEDHLQSKKLFSQFYALFLDIRAQNLHNISMEICSMGMSGDFEAAVEEGSDLVRLGTAIFGKRNYQQIKGE